VISSDTEAEVLVLRHELAVLRRQIKRPKLRRRVKLFLAAMSRMLPRERWPAFIVSPATLVRWHRELVRREWTFKHRPSRGRPPIDSETRALIVRMPRENPRWGCVRIKGEAMNRHTVADGHRRTGGAALGGIHTPPPLGERVPGGVGDGEAVGTVTRLIDTVGCVEADNVPIVITGPLPLDDRRLRARADEFDSLVDRDPARTCPANRDRVSVVRGVDVAWTVETWPGVVLATHRVAASDGCAARPMPDPPVAIALATAIEVRARRVYVLQPISAAPSLYPHP
jgi:hypothetical protein